jgi:hypothetical protein
VPPEVTAPPAWQEIIQVRVPENSGNQWLLTTSQIRAGAGSSFETWEAIGKPIHLSPAQLSMLRMQSEPAAAACLVSAKNGLIEVPVTLAANEVLHFELRPCELESGEKSELLTPAENAKIEAQLGEKSRS